MSYDYSEHVEAPKDENFAQLNVLTEQLHQANQKVIDLERQLNAAQARQKDIAERQIPELMDEMGLELLTTKTGLKVVVSESVHAQITKAKQDMCMDWLEENGHENLIKREVHVSFNREQQQEAADLVEDLVVRFPNVKQERKVHPSTLKSFVTQAMKDGAEIPLELFNVHRRRVAKIETNDE